MRRQTRPAHHVPTPLEMATWEAPLDRYQRETRTWAIITGLIISLPTLAAIGVILLYQGGAL